MCFKRNLTSSSKLVWASLFSLARFLGMGLLARGATSKCVVWVIKAWRLDGFWMSVLKVDVLESFFGFLIMIPFKKNVKLPIPLLLLLFWRRGMQQSSTCGGFFDKLVLGGGGRQIWFSIGISINQLKPKSFSWNFFHMISLSYVCEGNISYQRLAYVQIIKSFKLGNVLCRIQVTSLWWEESRNVKALMWFVR